MAVLEHDAAESNTMMTTRQIAAAKSGSVLMEFMLMMPILLLLFGATMLWMDISLGKMYIQEANRNLAWLTVDRYDDGKIKTALYDSVREPYELRNKIEKGFGGTGEMWKYAGGTTDEWGRVESRMESGSQRLMTDQECHWHAMSTGNMGLKMARLSGVYMGAVAIGSVLHPDEEKKHLYAAAYDFTRWRASSVSNDVSSASRIRYLVNPESFVIHRAYDRDNETMETSRAYVTMPNNLLPVLMQSWPTDGTSWEELAEEVIGALGGGEDGGNVDTGGEDSDDDPAKNLFLGINRPAITPVPMIDQFPAVMKEEER